MDALCKEIDQVAGSAGRRLPVHTIFFGGGTPSLVPVALMQKVMQAVDRGFDIQDDVEVTLEANPGTVNPDYLQGLRGLGFNRISFGMQSAHPDDLRLLERIHDYFDVVQAVKWARQAGFDNLSLDLIFGIPFQSMERWQHTVETALNLKPEHLSMYGLTIEHGTPFQHHVQRGLMPLPDDDLAADMYEWASERVEQAGMAQYEISNWAQQRNGRLLSSRHNLQYWQNEPYLGLGAGAHGYVAGVRTVNALGIRAYIQRVNQNAASPFPAGPAAVQAEPVDRWTAMQEMMMVGLRLTSEGVPSARFEQQFGLPLESVFGPQIDRLCELGLLTWEEKPDGRHLHLTKGGRLLGNQVFRQFVGEPKPAWLE
jgi:oxygen-independent coproporphyrinogen-3 oxidase